MTTVSTVTFVKQIYHDLGYGFVSHEVQYAVSSCWNGIAQSTLELNRLFYRWETDVVIIWGVRNAIDGMKETHLVFGPSTNLQWPWLRSFKTTALSSTQLENLASSLLIVNL